MSLNSKILDIFRQAINRAILPSTRAREEDILAKVEGILNAVRTGRMSREEAYYALIGLAQEYLIPLTPRDVGELRRALLGSPVSFV